MMSKFRTIGLVTTKVFDTTEDKIKNNAQTTIRNACTGGLYDLDDETLKELVKDLETNKKSLTSDDIKLPE